MQPPRPLAPGPLACPLNRKLNAMTTKLLARVAAIARPNVAEQEAKRNARFGRLNVAPTFEFHGILARAEAHGDVRAEFARRIAAGAK